MNNAQYTDASGPFEARYLAFLETIANLRPSLHRYCSRMTESVLDGEDVVQDVLFEAYRKRTSTTTAVHLNLGFFGLRTIDASISCAGVAFGSRRKLPPSVRIR